MTDQPGFSTRLHDKRVAERPERTATRGMRGLGRCPACNTTVLPDDQSLRVGADRYHAACALARDGGGRPADGAA